MKPGDYYHKKSNRDFICKIVCIANTAKGLRPDIFPKIVVFKFAGAELYAMEAQDFEDNYEPVP